MFRLRHPLPQPLTAGFDRPPPPATRTLPAGRLEEEMFVVLDGRWGRAVYVSGPPPLRVAWVGFDGQERMLLLDPADPVEVAVP